MNSCVKSDSQQILTVRIGDKLVEMYAESNAQVIFFAFILLA